MRCNDLSLTLVFATGFGMIFVSSLENIFGDCPGAGWFSFSGLIFSCSSILVHYSQSDQLPNSETELDE